jgi:hypothetical protein
VEGLRLEIEELVLENLNVSGARADRLRSEVESSLYRLLLREGLSPGRTLEGDPEALDSNDARLAERLAKQVLQAVRSQGVVLA